MTDFWILVVASRKRVSWGAILRKTTLVMEDLPLLWVLVSPDREVKALDLPFESHKQHFWLLLTEAHRGVAYVSIDFP